MEGKKHTEYTKLKMSLSKSTGKRPSKEVLFKMYIDDRLSTLKIGKLIGASNVTIAKWLRYYDIPVRTLRDASYGNKRALGHKLSEAAKHKLSVSHTGKVLSYEHRENISRSLQANFGIEVWKGFARPEGSYDRQRFTSTTRKKILARDNYTCYECKAIGGRLHVEHIKPWSTNPELRFDFDNCITLCISCHYAKTFSREYHVGAENWGNTKPIEIGYTQ